MAGQPEVSRFGPGGVLFITVEKPSSFLVQGFSKFTGSMATTHVQLSVCIARLVHYETYSDIRDAIAREKQIKGWRREKKVALIEDMNPGWKDLSAEWEV